MGGYCPLVSEGANCGPVVLAGFLEMDTDPAIELIGKAIGKPWPGFTNIGHIRKALELEGYSMVKIDNLSDEELNGSVPYRYDYPVMFFMQITGPWMGKGWRSEYNHTHWAIISKYGILDVNNRTEGMDRAYWIPPESWSTDVMPWLVKQCEGDGWLVKSCYEIRENKLFGGK